MVDISVEKYTHAKVCTIQVSNKKLFWVRMCDVQEGIGVKNVSDLVTKKKNWGILKIKIRQKIKSENIKDLKKNWIIILLLLLLFNNKKLQRCKKRKPKKKKRF